ncbi:exopolysaccharide biosynthesis polyprenyl glycosylphosphotransferase [Streptomyces xanthii]|uniref:Exopolysaccharide biosynthesis polyprenyl glycosylphosphotransferase n=1 Tax=Streptomyces xanthii TaxID=2768069 RepID=A0A7H1B824_9ACTN|nr:exopolysaccharide biosynthesis polyprenyl glycosylphosphotransferase [Streptomyces xanthii]QNS04879.1 exopolysaccharide biosynthesis polyprenyl glycosylphosphotransferase [Streptomyces xanthii]
MTPERTAAPSAGPLGGFSGTVVAPRAAGGAAALARDGGRPRDRPSRAVLVASDEIAALLATLALTEAQRGPLVLAAFVVLVLVLHATAGLYRYRPEPYMLDDLPAVAGRGILAWCVLAAALATLPGRTPLGPTALATGCAVQVGLALAGRALVHRRRRLALVRRPVSTLLVGPEAQARRVAAALQRHPRSGVRPVGVVGDPADDAEREDGDLPELPVLTTPGDVRRAVIQNGVRRALVLGGSGAPEHRARLHCLSELRCEIWELDPDPTPYVPLRARGEDGLAGFRCRPLAGPFLPVHPGKRALDVSVSAVLLVLLSPLLLSCALWLRLCEGPGVVFRQERIGKDGRPFTLLKFRTIRPADALESATRWSVADDRRMSRFCRFLRRTSIDELLQLWNVFRGDMSLVGPRPERPYFVMKFGETHPGYGDRHRVPTGITGLAQINGLRGDTSIEDRCRFDNAYIDQWSLWRDITILLRTAAEFVRPTGS